MLKVFNKKRSDGQSAYTGNQSYTAVQREAAAPSRQALKSPQTTTQSPAMASARSQPPRAQPSDNRLVQKEPSEVVRKEPMKAVQPVTSPSGRYDSKQTTKSSSHTDHQMAEFDDAETARLNKLFSENNKKSRNLSISRSGRHKVKKQNRLSVVEGEMFNSPEKGGHCAPDVPQLSISGPATVV